MVRLARAELFDPSEVAILNVIGRGGTSLLSLWIRSRLGKELRLTQGLD